ncbi:MAG: hypothetical protein HXS48_26135 [Theionarchaea archaeon]|nr:hypothetical protein [Theionarchaea archaeon]
MERIEVKIAENQLRQEFIQGYGYPPRIAEALVNTVTEHIRSIYPGERQDGQVIYRAVAKEEPAGKPFNPFKPLIHDQQLTIRIDIEYLKLTTFNGDFFVRS